MAYCGRKEHQRKEDGYIGRQFVFKSSKRKVGCAMLRYDTLQLRLSQGSELRLSPAWIHEVIISHYFENSLLAGGLGCSSAKSSLLLRDVVILLIRIQRFDLHGVLWSQGTPEEGRWLYRSTICI